MGSLISPSPWLKAHTFAILLKEWRGCHCNIYCSVFKREEKHVSGSRDVSAGPTSGGQDAAACSSRSVLELPSLSAKWACDRHLAGVFL